MRAVTLLVKEQEGGNEVLLRVLLRNIQVVGVVGSQEILQGQCLCVRRGGAGDGFLCQLEHLRLKVLRQLISMAL